MKYHINHININNIISYIRFEYHIKYDIYIDIYINLYVFQIHQISKCLNILEKWNDSNILSFFICYILYIIYSI